MLDVDAECRYTEDFELTSFDDKRIVETYVSNEEEKYFALSVINKEFELRGKLEHRKWFLEILSNAYYQHRITTSSFSDGSPESHVLSNMLKLSVANHYGIHLSDFKDDAQFYANVPSVVQEWFSILKRNVGTQNNTIKIVLQYGNSISDEELFGDFMYIPLLTRLNDEYAVEYKTTFDYGINATPLTDSMAASTHSIKPFVFHAFNDKKKIRSPTVDMSEFMLFMQRGSRYSLDRSELFMLYVISYVAKSETDFVYGVQVRKRANTALESMKKRVDSKAHELKELINGHMNTEVVYEKMEYFTQTLKVIERMEKEEYFDDLNIFNEIPDKQENQENNEYITGRRLILRKKLEESEHKNRALLADQKTIMEQNEKINTENEALKKEKHETLENTIPENTTVKAGVVQCITEKYKSVISKLKQILN